MAEKKWGNRTFWGVSYEYDPQWILNEEQKVLQEKLIEVCRAVIRPNALPADQQYEFPRKSLDALASLGLLGLMVPKELGGLGGSHVTAVMVVETIARYGCPSTAMVYVMHLGAVTSVLLRHHDNETIKNLLRRLDNEKLVGTLVFSDIATGGHFWIPLSSKARMLADGRIQFLKYGSWATSAGHADWYVVSGTSPKFEGDFFNQSSCYLLFKDEVRASADNWSALGMHGNQSGPTISEGLLTPDRVVGPFGDMHIANDEAIDPYFYLLSGACWNGIAMGCIDIAKKHVTTKKHSDLGKFVADYEIIQDYFGECIIDTNSSRLLAFGVAQGMDHTTNGNDWSMYADGANPTPRCDMIFWCGQVKAKAAAVGAFVSEKMLHACGGAGYKTDLGLERLFRDSKAGWVMGTSNEVIRQMVGKTALCGLDSLDLWERAPKHKIITAEVRKLTSDEKKSLAAKLLKEAEIEEKSAEQQPETYQDSEFDNPFNTVPAAKKGPYVDADGIEHKPALNPDTYAPLKLEARNTLWGEVAEYKFSLPHPTDHIGCLTGQYVKVKVFTNGPESVAYERSLSPVSSALGYGEVTVVLKHETQGPLSNKFRNMQPGDIVQFKGPCGGYEYIPNTIKHLILLTSGIGCTPAVQLLRDVTKNPDDKTSVSALFYAERESEILYKDEIFSYQGKDSQIKVSYTLGEVTDIQWKGGEGYIDTEMIQNALPTPNEFSLSQSLICGGPAMVLSSIHCLYELGYPSEKIFVYGPFGAEQIRTVYGRYAKLSAHKMEEGIKI